MTIIRNLLTTGAIAALVGVGALAATSSAASARTVCNSDGDCWHESSQYTYPSTVGAHYYGDDYRTTHPDSDTNHYTWRDNHDGRGYYRQGVWVTF
jgi:hypothetical protein